MDRSGIHTFFLSYWEILKIQFGNFCFIKKIIVFQDELKEIQDSPASQKRPDILEGAFDS